MTHATAEEIHDHAYGFRSSEHVAACPECRGASERIGAEREALRDVLREEEIPEVPPELLRRPRPAPRRISPAALAAAALLLGALSWMLPQPGADRSPAAPAAASQESEIYRLLGELKSSSPVRRRIAGQALTKYGGAALEALGIYKTDASRNLVDAVRGDAAGDRAMVARMKDTRITLKVEGALYTDVVRMLEPQVGRVVVDLSGFELETALISLHLENGTVYEAVEKISAQMKLPFSIQFGRLVIGKRPELITLAPVRIAAQPADVARHLADLSHDLPARRDEAVQHLRRLGFGAETALWEALDADSPETRSRAEVLLGELYGAVAAPQAVPVGWERRAKVSMHVEDVPVLDAIKEILRQADDHLSLIWEDSRRVLTEEHVSFAVREIAPEGALRLLLQPRNITCITHSDCALIASSGTDSLSTPAPSAVWLAPDVAREVESLIADIASGDPEREGKVRRCLRAPDESRSLEARPVLDGLAAASWALEGEALRRCQRLRRTFAASHRIWYQDIPSGADLQALAPAQRALLEVRIALPASDPLTLDALLKREGVRCEFRTPAAATYRGMGKAPTCGTLLKIALRPEGLDFYMEGETIVVDRAEKVQAAVEK
jgi:hypothetical protein